MPEEQKRGNQRWLAAGVSLLLIALVWLVFGQTLRHDFVNFDDDVYVYDEPRVMSGVTVAGLKWAFTSSHGYNWHPLTTISHMLDCQIYGTKAGGHHFTNLALHGIAAISLFVVLRQMTGALSRSAFVAALFAIHPLHVESVAWIAERKDVLSAVFFMFTIGAYTHYVRKPTLLRYVLVLIVFACGLMSKPMLVTLPFVLLLLDYWPLDRFTTRVATMRTDSPASWWNRPPILPRLILEKLPMFALAAVPGIVTILIQEQTSVPLPLRLYNASVSGVIYVWQMVWPSRLAPFYPYPSGRLSIWVPAFAIAMLAVVTYEAWALRKKHPYFITGWLWYLGMLVPVIGLLQVGLQSHADRYSYLPHIGLYLAATWAFTDLIAKWPNHFAISLISASAVIMALSVVAWKQTSYWKNSETVWKHTLAITSRNDIAHHSLGMAFLGKDKPDEAIANFREELKIRDNARGHASLAQALMQKGNATESFFQWQEALQLAPRDVTLRDKFAEALIQNGQPREAIADYEQSLKYKPDDLPALRNLGWILATAPDPSLRDGARAVLLAERGLQVSGRGRLDILFLLAAAYAENGRFADAIKVAKQTLHLAIEQNNSALVDDLEKDIPLFERNVPLRDSRLAPSTASP